MDSFNSSLHGIKFSSSSLENGLDAELDDELGYSRYDYKNKDTENSRNGHSNLLKWHDSNRLIITPLI